MWRVEQEPRGQLARQVERGRPQVEAELLGRQGKLQAVEGPFQGSLVAEEPCQVASQVEEPLVFDLGMPLVVVGPSVVLREQTQVEEQLEQVDILLLVLPFVVGETDFQHALC